MVEFDVPRALAMTTGWLDLFFFWLACRAVRGGVDEALCLARVRRTAKGREDVGRVSGDAAENSRTTTKGSGDGESKKLCVAKEEQQGWIGYGARQGVYTCARPTYVHTPTPAVGLSHCHHSSSGLALL